MSDDHDLISSPNPTRRSKSRIRFHDDVSIFPVQPYSIIYGQHPSTFVFGAKGERIKIKANEDHFTGIAKDEIASRIMSTKIDFDDRSKVFRSALLNGSAWETPTHELLGKMSPKKFKQKRIGAKAAKKAELF